MSISDLTKDFGDGLRLIALAEALTKARLSTKYQKTPKARVHFIENIHLALKHLSKASAVKIASYGTEGMRFNSEMTPPRFLNYFFSPLARVASNILQIMQFFHQLFLT